jgi:hypothetical protein
MSTALHARARRIRERALVLAWEYRQRHHAKGVWFRFRRLLVDAEEAWAIAPEDADRLEASGCVPLDVGRELAPPKRLLVVTLEQLAMLGSRSQVRVGLGSDMLGAENVALVLRGARRAPGSTLPTRHQKT